MDVCGIATAVGTGQWDDVHSLKAQLDILQFCETVAKAKGRLWWPELYSYECAVRIEQEYKGVMAAVYRVDVLLPEQGSQMWKVAGNVAIFVVEIGL